MVRCNYTLMLVFTEYINVSFLNLKENALYALSLFSYWIEVMFLYINSNG